MKLPSPQEIEEAKSERGGWSRDQLAEWGVAWPPPKGWRKSLEARWVEAKRSPADHPKTAGGNE